MHYMYHNVYHNVILKQHDHIATTFRIQQKKSILLFRIIKNNLSENSMFYSSTYTVKQEIFVHS